MLLHFHLTAKWFDLIKFGDKSVEYRSITKFTAKQVASIYSALESNNLNIRFYSGYPRKNDTSRFFDCKCVRVDGLYLSELPDAEYNFFVSQGYRYGLFFGFHVVRIY